MTAKEVYEKYGLREHEHKVLELHTIATFQGKEYELENLLNGLLNKLEEKDKEIERRNNIIETLKTEAFKGIMGFQREDEFSLGSRLAYQFIYNRINELMNLKGKENKNENNSI